MEQNFLRFMICML